MCVVSKRSKIKRYKNIYGKNKPISVFVWIGMLFFIAFLILLGWGLYEPVSNFIMSLGEPSGTVDPSGSDSPTPTPSPISTPAPTPTPPQSGMEVRAVYIPPSVLSNSTALDSLFTSIRGTAINSVVVDGKDLQGNILLSGDSLPTLATTSILPNAPDMGSVVSLIEAEGYTPIVRIHAFKDHILPMTEKESTIMYLDTEYTWFDNSPDLGGRPWLNPYSDMAQDYIISLATAFTEAGFGMVIADSVQFPTGVGQESANYGAQSEGISKTEVLTGFAVELEEAVSAVGGSSAVQIPSTGIVSPNTLIYGGNAALIPSDTAIVELFPTLFTQNSKIGDTAFPSPSLDYDGVVEAAGEVAIDSISQGVNSIALLLATTPNGTVLTPQEVDSQVKIVESLGYSGYILYGSSGSYRLK